MFSNLQKSVRTWRRSTFRQRRLLLEASIYSVTIRLLLNAVPFRLIAPRLRLSHEQQNDVNSNLLQQVGWIVEKVGRFFKWRNVCLVNAIVAKLMLRRRGVPSTLFLGLAKDARRNLKAHAWLTVDEFVITGGPHHTQYVVMTSFADVPNG